MDLSLRVIEYIQSFAYQVATSEGTLTASQMLERFLFPASTHSTVLARLSGGERKRLYLLRILMEAPNVLLFDEPTNDLDIETLTVLENYLESFHGAVIVISHDRYFLDRVVHRIFSFEGNGEIGHYPGGYTDYLELYQFEEKERLKKPQPVAEAASSENPNHSKTAKLKFSYHEQREFATIDDDIAGLEQKLKDIEHTISGESSDYEKLQGLLEQKQIIEDELNRKMERWVYLNDLAEKLAAK
jgi:ATP-binding cassette subfamily F protein uup